MKAIAACAIALVLFTASLAAQTTDPLVISPDGSVNVNGPLNVRGAVVIAVPVGTVLAWYKTSVTGLVLPYGWIECNGQQVTDPESPLYQQNLPDMNDYAHGGAKGRFIRGTSDTTKVGTLETDATRNITGWHFDDLNSAAGGAFYSGYSQSNTSAAGSGKGKIIFFDASQVLGAEHTADEVRPVNVRLVYIMRVK